MSHHTDSVERLADAKDALDLLRLALGQSKLAGSRKTTERIRLAISSAKGAVRNARARVLRGNILW